jgi:hypothetical protein
MTRGAEVGVGGIKTLPDLALQTGPILTRRFSGRNAPKLFFYTRMEMADG